MATTQYRCGTERRRRRVRETDLFNGIDYLEVGPGQTQLLVHFVHDLPGTADPHPAGPALVEDNLVVEGGTRFANIEVTGVSAENNVLEVTLNAPGDYSTYTLRLRRSAGDPGPPDGFDPQLCSVRFSFKVACPSNFDCRDKRICPEQTPTEPELDYLAKDYASFRTLMLDRMSAIMPDWQERNPADVQIALVEMLAYVGDHLSYFEDAVATESYLGTALTRPSVRRHARLLDYRMHEGCNARTWMSFEVAPGAPVPLERGRKVLCVNDSESAPTMSESEFERIVAAEPTVVFETLLPAVLRSSHNRIALHTWSDLGCCLPAGATRATLQDPDGALHLAPGDYLLFEEVAGPSGAPQDADPAHRQVVRLTGVNSTMKVGGVTQPLADPIEGQRIVEVEWDYVDSLTFPLCISTIGDDGTLVASDLSVARGNVIPADQGMTLRDRPLLPEVVPTGRSYRPSVPDTGITFCEPFGAELPARAALQQNPRKALPSIRLSGDGTTWEPQFDLLASGRFKAEFVVETDARGASNLRFGDNFQGRSPSPAFRFTATYRVGSGTSGNVGAESLAKMVHEGTGVTRVRNPLPAAGGVDPEPIAKVKLEAPHAFRSQERAVTEADYGTVAGRLPEVQRAAGRLRWTGSWYTAFVTVDRLGGRLVDGPFRRDLVRHLDLFRMAGVDLEVSDPVSVPLNLALEVCVKAQYLSSDVEHEVRELLSNRLLPGGGKGFFHPDNYTFAQPVFLSQIYEVVMGVEGVKWVIARRFQRWGALPNGELDQGVLTLGSLEVIRLDNEPSSPENGQLELTMRGGR